jgi:uncharacterized protein YlbG (UPF0298 family)
MKYVLLFVETEEVEQNLEAMSQADRQAVLRRRIDWGDDAG